MTKEIVILHRIKFMSPPQMPWMLPRAKQCSSSYRPTIKSMAACAVYSDLSTAGDDKNKRTECVVQARPGRTGLAGAC